MLSLRFCARAFSSCGKRGPPLIAVRGPRTIAACLVAEHRLQTRRLSSCGSRAQSLRGMWDPPRPGLEPMSSALAGRFSTTAPPGKPYNNSYNVLFIHMLILWNPIWLWLGIYYFIYGDHNCYFGVNKKPCCGHYNCLVYSVGSRVSEIWLPVPALPLINCMALGKLFSLLLLKMGIILIPPT